MNSWFSGFRGLGMNNIATATRGLAIEPQSPRSWTTQIGPQNQSNTKIYDTILSHLRYLYTQGEFIRTIFLPTTLDWPIHANICFGNTNCHDPDVVFKSQGSHYCALAPKFSFLFCYFHAEKLLPSVSLHFESTVN